MGRVKIVVVSISEIYEVIDKECGVNLDSLKPDSDLYSDFGVDGDDFFELMEAFSKRFSVDISEYRWYFHHHDEFGAGIFGWFSSPLDRELKRIPVTPSVLLASANSGVWVLSYPDHHFSKRRKRSLWLAVVFVVMLLIFFLIGWHWPSEIKPSCF